MIEAEKVAERIASLSPYCRSRYEGMMVRAASLDYSAVDQITDWVQTRVMNSDDRKEGAKAFAEKEK